ncbi:50S ribosomal protein L22 [Methanoplanus sp. FWC-SCC4]|uniref:Large ribosomal subunit protein uL22 n=1 Tax=Methanochimaera problematica TaxID=2609417 RepID=A0AA97FC43_9EURY|nr:50S ribosomal protein L22 [Methanoplanus sp. FWC-SCC4]WOF15513.1 50S ribosomal protein L22 [Methanoplanus sp. FWC-SCC4]
MARTNYSLKMEAEQIARAKANELPISPKHAIEITRFIKGKTTKEAIAYLEDVVALKKAIPFKRFNRNVAHKRGLDKWDAGRYPVKASSEFLKVLRSVEKNAEYIGLDTEKLEIFFATSNRGRRQRGIFPRAMGRATAKFAESANVEIMVREVE